MSATMAPLVPALDDAARRGTGCLNVTGPQAGQEAQIFFHGGLIYAIHLHDFTPLIGRRLLDHGALSGDQYATLLTRLNGNEADPAIGVQAVKAGYFREDVLNHVLADVLSAAFVDVLSWPNPSTKWKRRARTAHLTAPGAQITALLQAARRRTAQWHARWDTTGHAHAEVRPLAVVQEQDSHPDGMSRLLSLADGESDLRAIGSRCGLTYLEAGEAFLILHEQGQVTFLSPAEPPAPTLPPSAKDSPMTSALPVPHASTGADSVPGLPLPPLPNFDGQTLPPPAALPVESPASVGSVVDTESHLSATSHATTDSLGAPVEPTVPVDFTVPVSVADDTPGAAEPDLSASHQEEVPLGSGVAVEMPDAAAADGPTGGVVDGAIESAPTAETLDPRVAAQQALLADELDAARQAVAFAEATIARLKDEEQGHHEAAEQAATHQQRYEAFLLSASSDLQRLADEQAEAAAEAEVLAATAEDLTSARTALDERLAAIEEVESKARTELEAARVAHESAMEALEEAREAAAQMARQFDDMHLAAEANNARAAQVVQDLAVVQGRTEAYTAEIEEVRQSASDLAEAASASARLRERAEQRLAAAQATLSAKESQVDA